MKKTKILIIFIIMIFLFSVNSVYASSQIQLDARGGTGGNNTNTQTNIEIKQSSMISTDDFKPGDLTEDDYKVAFDKTSNIVSVITTVGIVIAIIMVVVLGIRYMCGSVEERADYKKTMIPVIIGAILLFSASTIVSVIYSIVSKL